MMADGLRFMRGSYPVSRAIGVVCATLVALALAPVGTAGDGAVADEHGDAVKRAETLAARHRYLEVVELLEPVVGDGTGVPAAPEAAYALGRAYFHLGRYRQAYDALKRAAEVRPSSTEGLEYLEASAYLLDRRKEALTLFERILASGRTDLVLALTLPGERAFLRDPEAWQILTRYARAFDVSLVHGTVMGVALGASRSEVEGRLKDVPRQLDDPDGTTALKVVQLDWDDGGRLAGLVVSAEELLRYTPFRLNLDHGLGWRSAPDDAVEHYGAPASFVPEADGGVRMTWRFPGWSGTLSFGPPRPPRPAPIEDGRALLRRVELRRVAQSATE